MRREPRSRLDEALRDCEAALRVMGNADVRRSGCPWVLTSADAGDPRVVVGTALCPGAPSSKALALATQEAARQATRLPGLSWRADAAIWTGDRVALCPGLVDPASLREEMASRPRPPLGDVSGRDAVVDCVAGLVWERALRDDGAPAGWWALRSSLWGQGDQDGGVVAIVAGGQGKRDALESMVAAAPWRYYADVAEARADVARAVGALLDRWRGSPAGARAMAGGAL